MALVKCDECGAQISDTATSCPKCGYKAPATNDTPATDDTPVKAAGDLDIGDICSTSWTIYKKHMGLVSGGVAIVMIIGQMPSLLSSIAFRVAIFGTNDVPPDARVPFFFGFFGISVVFKAIAMLAGSYLMCGTTLLLLNVVKGRPAEIMDIFRGVRYFWRMFFCGFIYTLMVFFGTLACIIPGIILGLMFGFYNFVLVERDSRGLKALSQSMDLTRGHKLNLLVLVIAMTGIEILGLMVCCVGLFFTTPLVWVMATVAYMRMSDQKTIAG